MSRYYPAIGGGELATRALVNELAKTNKITVITQRTDNDTNWLYGTTINAPSEELRIRDINSDIIMISPSRISRIAMYPWVKLYDRVRFLSVPALAKIILPYLRISEKPEIIHNVYIGREYLSLASHSLSKEYGVPFVFTPIAHTHKVYWNSYYMNYLYENANGLVAMTEYEKEWLLKKGAKGEIIVNGVAPVGIGEEVKTFDFKSKFTNGKDYILFIGQKNPYKGYKLLVNVFKVLKDEFPELCLVLMGAGFGEKFFGENTDERIIYRGNVTDEEKKSAFASCIAFCLPSTEESFGGVFLEAWSFKKPVIGCPLKEISSWIENEKEALLVSPETDKWTAALKRLLKDEDLQKRLGEAGYVKLKSKYSWEIISERTLKFYERLKVKKNA